MSRPGFTAQSLRGHTRKFSGEHTEKREFWGVQRPQV